MTRTVGRRVCGPRHDSRRVKVRWVTPLGTSLFERLTRRLAKKLNLDLEDATKNYAADAVLEEVGAMLERQAAELEHDVGTLMK